MKPNSGCTTHSSHFFSMKVRLRRVVLANGLAYRPCCWKLLITAGQFGTESSVWAMYAKESGGRWKRVTSR
jgi:hypothetical protein